MRIDQFPQKDHFNFLFLVRNFEESEDELREAVADSMKNLFVMEDGSSDEAEHTEERAAANDGMEENEDVGAVSAADSQQIQPEVEDSRADVVSNEPEECYGQSEHSDDNTTLNKQQHTTWVLTNIQPFILSDKDSGNLSVPSLLINLNSM